MSAHKHAAMIKEWAEDTSRVVQVQLEDFGWMDQPNPNFDPDFEWRFADNVKPEVTSPLSDGEIDAIWWSLKPVGNEMPSHHDIGRAIANAAHARCLQDEAKVREELIARYDSLQSQYAELSVALDSAAQESVCKVDLKDDGVWAHFSCDGKHFSTCLGGIRTARWFVEAFEKKQVKPTHAPEQQNDFDINVSGRTVPEDEPQTVTSTLTDDSQKIALEHRLGFVQAIQHTVTDWETGYKLIWMYNEAVESAAKAQDALTRKAVIREIAAMSSVITSEIAKKYNGSVHGLNAGIAEFQRKLLAGIGETK